MGVLQTADFVAQGVAELEEPDSIAPEVQEPDTVLAAIVQRCQTVDVTQAACVTLCAASSTGQHQHVGAKLNVLLPTSY